MLTNIKKKKKKKKKLKKTFLIAFSIVN